MTRPLNTLLASAKRMTASSIKKAKNNGAGTGWQADAWDLYDLVGEQRFLTTTLAGRVGQARLYVGKLPEDPTEQPEPVEDGPAAEAFNAFGGSASARSQLMYRMAINMSVPGEGWFVGIPKDPENLEFEEDGITPKTGIALDDLDWRMMSSEEVVANSKGKIEIEGDEWDPDSLFMMKVWRPHPRNWKDADSPTRSSLPVLRELVGLTMHVSAQVDSRLAGAGLLVVPQSAQDALRSAQSGDEDIDEVDDLFTEALIEAMTTPIKDRSNASAVVPLVITVPDEAADKFSYMTFSTTLDTEARELRDEAIRRLALGQDAPPEILLGTGGMNHWGAWLVKEDTITTHVEPPLALICDALTTQYLWPVLTDSFGMDEDEARQYAIWFDVEHLILRPNRTTDAFTLHERGVITDEAVRDAAGFSDTDAPIAVESDAAVQQALELVAAAPSLVQDPGLPALVQQIRDMLSGSAPTPDTPEEEPSGPLPETDQDDAPESEITAGATPGKLVPELEFVYNPPDHYLEDRYAGQTVPDDSPR